MSAWTKADGAMIELRFSQPLNPVSDADASHFTITVPEYTYVPGGEIVNISKAVAHVSNKTEADAYSLILETQPLQRFESAVGNIVVGYDGAGSLSGKGGAVAAFEKTFTPTELVWKGDQNDPEHLSIAGVTVAAVLTRIYYTSVQGAEHLSISGVSATAALTHINDI